MAATKARALLNALVKSVEVHFISGYPTACIRRVCHSKVARLSTAHCIFNSFWLEPGVE